MAVHPLGDGRMPVKQVLASERDEWWMWRSDIMSEGAQCQMP